MIEQDYIMRIIKEIIRTIIKLLFHIDTESPNAELLEDKQSRNTLNELMDMIDYGQINEAENRLLSITETGNMNDLQMALLFYSYLNDKDDAFLLDNDYTREEIKAGLQGVASRYGLSGLIDVFLCD